MTTRSETAPLRERANPRMADQVMGQGVKNPEIASKMTANSKDRFETQEQAILKEILRRIEQRGHLTLRRMMIDDTILAMTRTLISRAVRHRHIVNKCSRHVVNIVWECVF